MSIFSTVQGQKFKLAGSGITSSATTIILQTFKNSAGTTITTSDIGAIGFLTLEPSTSREENVSFTTVTQNSDGTATLTGVTRGLSFVAPYTNIAANQKAHAGGTIAVLSNSSAFYNQYPAKANDETITGYWLCPDPIGLTGIANKQYVASVVAGGAITTDKLLTTGTAGETVAAGKIVYLKAADGRWWLADADLTATIDNVQLGIAQGSGTAGNSITGGVLLRGVDGNQSGLATGTKYYVSNTAGGVSSSVGTLTRTIGNAKSGTELYFDPYFGEHPTGNQIAAMAGVAAVPSSTNKFLGQKDAIASDVDQTQTSQDTSSTVGEADATTKHNKLAQSFIPAYTKIKGVKLYKSADTGSFTGTVTISVQADSASAPSGSALGTVTITNAQWLLIPTGEFEIAFTSEYTGMTIGSTYWIVIETSTSDNSNHPNIGAISTGGYGSGSVKFKNTTDGWTAIATIDLYFKTINGTTSQIIEGDATSGRLPVNVLPYALVELNNTQTTVATSTTETTVYTKALPASFFTATSGLKITGLVSQISHRVVTGVAQSVAIKVKLNGTTIATMTVSAGTGGIGGTGTLDPMAGHWYCTIINTTTSAQKYTYAYTFSDSQAGSTGDTALLAPYAHTTKIGVGTSAVNTTAANILTVTYTNSESNASTNFTHDSILLEKIG